MSTVFARRLCSATRPATPRARRFLTSYRLGVAIALPTLAFVSPLHCQEEIELPRSALDPTQLGFGTVAGICTGVFLVKGAKLIAVLLGGTFVLVQYLASRSFLTVNWAGVTSSYDGLVQRKLGSGNRIKSLATGIVDFLTTGTQFRLTFIAGLGLGLRLG